MYFHTVIIMEAVRNSEVATLSELHAALRLRLKNGIPAVCNFCPGIFVGCIQIIRLTFTIVTLSKESFILGVRKFV